MTLPIEGYVLTTDGDIVAYAEVIQDNMGDPVAWLPVEPDSYTMEDSKVVFHWENGYVPTLEDFIEGLGEEQGTNAWEARLDKAKAELIASLEAAAVLSRQHDEEAASGDAFDALIKYVNDSVVTALCEQIGVFYG